MFEVNKTEICIGETVSFTDIGSIDYDTHIYNFDDGQTSSSINTQHTFNNSGIHRVSLTVVDTSTGLEAVYEQVINVQNYPLSTVSISLNSPLCFGEIATLTADDPNVNYLWSTGETSQSIDVATSGVYQVELYHDSGASCNVFSDPITFDFYPEIDDSIFLQTDPLLLVANQQNANYQWVDCSNDNMPIPNATEITYTPIANGDYAVEISQNNCIVTSECQTVNTLQVIDNTLKQFVQLYPNPTKEFISVKSEIPILIEFYNATGQKVLEKNKPSGKNTFSIRELSDGIYLVKVSSLSVFYKNQYSIYKIIKN